MRNFILVSGRKVTDEQMMKLIKEEVKTLIDEEIAPYQRRIAMTNRQNRVLSKKVTNLRKKKPQSITVLQVADIDVIRDTQLTTHNVQAIQRAEATQSTQAIQNTPTISQVNPPAMSTGRAPHDTGSINDLMLQFSQLGQSTAIPTQSTQPRIEGKEFSFTCPKCHKVFIHGWTEFEDHVVRRCIKPYLCRMYNQNDMKMHERGCKQNKN